MVHPDLRAVRAALVALLVLSAVAAGALAPAVGVVGQGAEGDDRGAGLVIRLAEVPTDRVDDPRARQYIIDHVDPGTTIRRRVEVANESDGPFEARLYAGGAVVEDGAFVPSGRDAVSELATWTSVEPGAVSLSPGEQRSVTATIEVPASASAGERYGAVWAEVAGPTDPSSGITTVNRVGIRIYLSVGGGSEEPPTRFSLPTFTPTRGADGRPGVDIEACNDGERAIDLSGSLSLSDGPGGVSAGPFPSERPALTLAPAQCGEVEIRLSPDIPLGPWKATATLRSGPFEESASATITFPSEAGSSSEPVAASPREVTGTGGGRLALLVALLLLLVVLALLLWWLWRRRRDRPEIDGGEPTSEVAPH